MSNASVPEEVKEIFGPLKLSMQDSIQRVSSTATRFSRSVFSTSSLRSDKPPQPQHQSQSQLGSFQLGSFQLKSIHQDPPSHSFGLRSSFGKGAKATTENFRAPGRSLLITQYCIHADGGFHDQGFGKSAKMAIFKTNFSSDIALYST